MVGLIDIQCTRALCVRPLAAGCGTDLHFICTYTHTGRGEHNTELNSPRLWWTGVGVALCIVLAAVGWVGSGWNTIAATHADADG